MNVIKDLAMQAGVFKERRIGAQSETNGMMGALVGAPRETWEDKNMLFFSFLSYSKPTVNQR